MSSHKIQHLLIQQFIQHFLHLLSKTFAMRTQRTTVVYNVALTFQATMGTQCNSLDSRKTKRVATLDELNLLDEELSASV